MCVGMTELKTTELDHLERGTGITDSKTAVFDHFEIRVQV